MKLNPARQLAQRIADTMQLYADSVTIAGAIRRRVAEIRELDLVVVPKLGEPDDLFSEHRPNLMLRWADAMADEKRIEWLSTSTWERVPAPIIRGARWWRGWAVAAGIVVNVRLTPPEHYGVALWLATGDREYTRQVEDSLRGFHVAEGKLVATSGKDVPTLSEAEFYEAIGLGFVEPWERRAVDTRLEGLR